MASHGKHAGLGYVGHGGGGRKPCITSFVDDGSVESHRYYLARRTVLEMLRDRGSDIPESEIKRSLSEFRTVFGNKPDLERLRISASLCLNPSFQILVIFCGTAEIRKHDAIGIFSQIVNKESLHCVILVLQNKMNSYAQKVAEQFPVKVETFHIADLLVNITKHVLAPKHVILTSTEKNQLLKQHNVEDKQIPRMLVTDAIARYYGLEKGQVVKISHTGGLTDTLASYRCVT